MTKENKHRSYCLTINNWKDEHVQNLKCEKYKYIIIGNEHAPETNTPHLQVYIQYKNPITFNSLKKRFPTAHIEPSGGNAEQNQKYCSKEEVLYEDGDLPKQGKRSDIEVCKDIIQDTNSMREVVRHATSVQGVRMAEIWLKYHEAPRNWKPHVVWISGASGIGKSKLAYEMAGEENTYTCMKTGRWFEGYDAHETVIIDDIRKDFMKFAEFLQLIDRYTFRVECKGGSRQFLAKKIIITSIYPPEMLWSTREDIYQLTRRIDEQITFQGAERKPKDYDLISDDETL